MACASDDVGTECDAVAAVEQQAFDVNSFG